MSDDEDNSDSKRTADNDDNDEAEGFGMVEGDDDDNDNGNGNDGEGDNGGGDDGESLGWQNLSMIQRQYLLQLLGAIRGDDDTEVFVGPTRSRTATATATGHTHATHGHGTNGNGMERKDEVLVLDEDRDSLHEYAHRFRLQTDAPTKGNAFSLLTRHSSRPVAQRTTNREPALSRFIPNECTGTMEFGGKTFCGKFSSDGSSFAVAAQDEKVRVYDTAQWKLIREINVADMGWSIVDIDYSPDGRFVAYSSWSELVHVCNVDGKFELHESLDLQPNEQGCFFGIKFAPHNSEMLAGGSGGYGILFDIERKKRVWIHKGHSDDVNSVTWIDTDSGLPGQLFATASDDCLTKIWDRRVLRSDGKASGGAIGGFIGHAQGLTCVSSLGDARYILTNSKDQSMKLWDLRKLNTASELKDGGNQRQGRMDYRWQRYARSGTRKEKDHSLMTYLGHSVVRTLIRCGFSPPSTNHQYVYSGSFDGACYVFHAVTGKIAAKLDGHEDIVRDVSWHPYRPTIITSSWDETCRRYDYHGHNLTRDDDLDPMSVPVHHDDTSTLHAQQRAPSGLSSSSSSSSSHVQATMALNDDDVGGLD